MTGRELLAKAFTDEPVLTADTLTCEGDFNAHLRRFPDDVNFIATRTPGNGYGSVVCMEDACFAEIPLDPNPMAPDGGVARGFGWLQKYWDHIEKTPAHKTARDARVAKDKLIKAEAPPDSWTPKAKAAGSGWRPSSALSSDAEGSRARNKDGLQLYLPLASGSGLRTNGAASGSGLLPKKRKSDGLKPRSSAGNVFDDDGADKKPKVAANAVAANASAAKDLKPGVFAERQNAAQGAAAGVAPLKAAEQTELAKVRRSIERWESVLAGLRRESDASRDQSWYDEFDEANRELIPLRTKLRMYDGRPGAAPPTPAAKPAALTGALAPAAAAKAKATPPLQFAADNNHVNGDWTCLSTAPLPVRNLFWIRPEVAAATYPAYVKPAAAGPIAGPSGAGAGVAAGAGAVAAFPGHIGYQAGRDPMGAAMNALAGMGAAGRADDGEDSDEERMWGQLAPVKNTEDFDAFLKAATEGEGFEGNVNVMNACKAIGIERIGDKVPHMTVHLLPHQIIACAWTKQQEEGKTYGGIIGDEMGLGKTIEAIATCLLNESRDPKEKTTLIVAPLALLAQWRAELEEKVEDGYLSILTYHGAERKKYKRKHIIKYDFVLTTYGTLVADFEDEEALEKKARKAAKKANEAENWEDYLEAGKGRGPLFDDCSFYRVILDEAQSIRNKSTKISRAVMHLDSLYRWALTGTPVTNSLGDLWPLFRFLQLKCWHDYKTYQESVLHYEKKHPDIAGRKAQAILRTCMLRRKKDSKLDGKELISLPEKHIDMHELEFSTEERKIYEMVEQRAQAKFNKFLKAGTVMKNYSHVLLLILRLRQVCFHPALIADAEQTLAMQEEAKGKVKNELARAKKEMGLEVVKKIRRARLEAAVERCQAEREGKGTEAASNDDCPLCLEDVLASEGGSSVTKCGHIFCTPCINGVIEAPLVDDQDDEGADKRCKADQRPCPICRQPVGTKDLYDRIAFEPTDEELCTATGQDAEMDEEDGDETLGGFIVPDEEDDDEFAKAAKKKAPKQPNRAVIQDSDEDEPAQQSEAEEELAPKADKGKGKKKVKSVRELLWMKEQEPSTKMVWVMNELERMFRDNPDDKIIVISSFVTALDMMDNYLKNKDVRTLRYQGDMSIGERDETLRIFRKSKKRKVMLLSLKCGGVGLTLTRANRVISLDLAWSNAVESQAFDRVHRIGQAKEVFVNRLTIANTVEQRILTLQDKKQGLADAATGEGKAHKMGKLTVADLAGLFGLNARGERLNN
ncbi:hypothetical protein JCM10450v2_000471 [Rhodotorula kratochvilovae]